MFPDDGNDDGTGSQNKSRASSGLGALGMELAMTPAEGIETFRRLMTCTGRTRVVVSTGDLQVRLDRWVKLSTLRQAQSGNVENTVSGSNKLHERPKLMNPYSAPGNETERKITDIWQSFFGFEVGVEDDFFELGGDSLKALTIVGKIHRQMKVELPVTEMFKNPVIRHLAKYIAAGTAAQDEDVVILLNEESPKKLFGLPPVVGEGIVYKEIARGITGHAFYSFNYIEDEDRIKQYIDTITAIHPEGPYILLGYSAGGTMGFAIAKEMEKQGYHVAALILLDVYRTGRDREATESEMAHFRRFMLRNLDEKHIDFERYKQKIADTAEKYYAYVRSLSDDGTICADIHLITGLDRKEEDCYQWENATTGKYYIHQGFNTHNNLLDQSVKEKNSGLLQDILDKID
jgi:tyrocidine synthetase-3